MAIWGTMTQVGERDSKESQKVNMLGRAIAKTFFYDFYFSNQTGYFKTLELFWIGVRVAGKTNNFDGAEGPEFLKKARGKPYYTIDLVIPEHRWKGVEFNEFRSYFLDGVRQCFELMVAKAKKDKELVNEEKLRHDFEAGMKLIAEADKNDEIFQLVKPEDMPK